MPHLQSLLSLTPVTRSLSSLTARQPPHSVARRHTCRRTPCTCFVVRTGRVASTCMHDLDGNRCTRYAHWTCPRHSSHCTAWLLAIKCNPSTCCAHRSHASGLAHCCFAFIAFTGVRWTTCATDLAVIAGAGGRVQLLAFGCTSAMTGIIYHTHFSVLTGFTISNGVAVLIGLAGVILIRRATDVF